MVLCYVMFVCVVYYYIAGIAAASILGYILPVAIYLKTHEYKVRRKLVDLRLRRYVYDRERDLTCGADDSSMDSDEQCDFNRNFMFFVFLGVFGVCSLMVGLTMEVLSVFGVGRETDPTTIV